MSNQSVWDRIMRCDADRIVLTRDELQQLKGEYMEWAKKQLMQGVALVPLGLPNYGDRFCGVLLQMPDAEAACMTFEVMT